VDQCFIGDNIPYMDFRMNTPLNFQQLIAKCSIHTHIQGVLGGIVNILGFGSMGYSE